MTIVIYTRDGCHLCDDAHRLLIARQSRFDFELTSVDVDADPELAARFGDRVPVVVVDGRERFSGNVPPALLDRLLAGGGRLRGR